MAARKRRRRNQNLIVAAIAVLISAGLLAILTRGDASPTADAAPDVALEYFDGRTVTLEDLEGEPIVLNFWASWCPACVSEMPAFAEVHAQVGDKVNFIGVNMQEVSLEAAADLVDRTGVEYSLVHDRSGAIFLAFDGIAMPTTVFIDSDGSVARVHAGALFEEQLLAIIEEELLG
jgi:thiol-disulfide isomerase/thioredoxin